MIYKLLLKLIQMFCINPYKSGRKLRCNPLEKILEAFPSAQWDWNILSSNNHLSLKIVQENLDMPWDWNSLTGNPNVATWEIVRNNPDKSWNWSILSGNSNITWEIVQANPN